MIHLGDITKISGYDVPFVDCIIGGSPCQDLSVAGKRAGLTGERSGLFMEQIRIIKEMREASERTTGIPRPRFTVWENVPGALSSNKGKDFRVVLEEFARIADKNAVIPESPKGKWSTAGAVMGDGWSIAWRVLDAQFWGVPQRRRRIALVADFGGYAAPEILFERKGLSGDTAESRTQRGGASAGVKGSVGDAEQTVICLQGSAIERADTARQYGKGWRYDKCYTLTTVDRPAVLAFDATQITSPQNGSHPHYGDPCHTLAAGAHAHAIATEFVVMAHGQANAEICEDLSPTLNCDHEQPIVAAVDCRNGTENQNVNGTLQAKSSGGMSVNLQNVVRVDKTVRRLTPLECERLQGYPDGWTDIGDWTDSQGKSRKTSDSARYKALGNSIALPPWKWVLKRLCSCYERDATMASLFDGIGGFPLIWEQLNGKGTCLWASEIEEFPIAVTKLRFGGISTMVLDGQISFAELISPDKAKNQNLKGLRAVGDLIGRRVLGEVRTAHITEIEGLPYFPFYRTDSGGCYDVKEGYTSIEELERQAEAERTKYKTIVPENLANRITWQYTRGTDNRVLWAQIGIMDGMLFWKDDITYQFLEPYDTPKKLKKAYDAKKKEIEEHMQVCGACLEDGEHPMRRLYWSVHGFYADAEYVKTNG